VEAGAGEGSLGFNVEKARALLAEAGYPGGENFPRIRLLINRNEQQRLVAQAVARMWRDGLGVETEIIARGWEEYEAMLRAGDYDLARRSLVMQTSDEATNMLELFADETDAEAGAVEAGAEAADAASTPATENSTQAGLSEPRSEPSILSEAQALRELPAIPLHFASSYALVKPYVDGFENNLLDAPSLKNVSINTAWRNPSESQAGGTARARRR
jgi:oligopeptide transport system substrate-binding protein